MFKVRPTHIPHITRLDSTQQFHPLLKLILFPHLLKLHHLWPVSPYKKAHVGERGAYARGRGY